MPEAVMNWSIETKDGKRWSHEEDIVEPKGAVLDKK
jgi:hypothetical protein